MHISSLGIPVKTIFTRLTWVATAFFQRQVDAARSQLCRAGDQLHCCSQSQHAQLRLDIFSSDDAKEWLDSEKSSGREASIMMSLTFAVIASPRIVLN